MNSLFPISRRSMLDRDFDNIFDSFFSYSPASWSGQGISRQRMKNTPDVNVLKDERGFAIQLATPGFSRDDLKIEVHENTLIVSLKQDDVQENAVDNYTSREFNYSAFTRSWQLPERVDVENINARYDAGILTVHVPVEKNEPTVRRISVD